MTKCRNLVTLADGGKERVATAILLVRVVDSFTATFLVNLLVELESVRIDATTLGLEVT